MPKSQIAKINWKIKSILSALATRALYFLKKSDTKRPFSPSWGIWPICNPFNIGRKDHTKPTFMKKCEHVLGNMAKDYWVVLMYCEFKKCHLWCFGERGDCECAANSLDKVQRWTFHSTFHLPAVADWRFTYIFGDKFSGFFFIFRKFWIWPTDHSPITHTDLPNPPKTQPDFRPANSKAPWTVDLNLFCLW